MLKLEKPWTRQPQTPTGVSGGHQLTSGLAFLYNAAARQDTVTGSVLSGASGVVPTGDGVGYSHTGPSTIPTFGHSPTWNVNEGNYWTIFVYLYQNAQSGVWRGLISKRDANTSTGSWSIVGDTSNNCAFYFNGNSNVTTLGAFPTAAGLYKHVLLRRGGELRYYRNGQLISSPAISINNAAGNVSSLRFGVGRNDATSENVTGAYIQAGIWPGLALSDADAQSLSSLQANPWQLFAPRRIWVPVTAAPTGPTVTALLRQRSQFIGSGLR